MRHPARIRVGDRLLLDTTGWGCSLIVLIPCEVVATRKSFIEGEITQVKIMGSPTEAFWVDPDDLFIRR